MLSLRKVAITGGVASGKSTVCELLKRLGAHVASADAIVHKLLTPRTDLGQQVIRLLGPDIVNEQQIDRLFVANKVFHDFSLLQALEAILHPPVFEEIERLYQEAAEARAPLFAAEVPLLFEVGAQTRFDLSVAVFADEEVAQARFGAKEYSRLSLNLPNWTQDFDRGGSAEIDANLYNVSEIEHNVLGSKDADKLKFNRLYARRMRRQFTPEQKAARADYVLFNNGSVQELSDQVKFLYTNLMRP